MANEEINYSILHSLIYEFTLRREENEREQIKAWDDVRCGICDSNSTLSYDYNYVKNTTLDTIKVTVSLTIWEDQDGYQDVYVYNGNQQIAAHTFEHGPGWTHTEHGQYTHNFTFELSSYKDIDQLTIRFGAHGLFWNAWNFSDLEVRIYLTN